MGKLKETIYNCRQATFLIEKKQLTKLSWREQFDLKIHLTGCSVCQLYQKQSIFISRLAKNIFQTQGTIDVKLDPEFKAIMQSRIQKEMEKN